MALPILIGGHHEITQSPNLYVVPLPMEKEPKLLYAHGAVLVGKEVVRYTLAGTESCDPSFVTAIMNGLGGFKSSSRGWRDANAQDAQEFTLSLSPVRNDGVKNNLFHPQRAQAEALEAILCHAKSNQQVKDLPNGDRIDFDRVRLQLQSMAGLTIAELPDENIEAVTFVVSTGFNGGDAIGHLAHVATHIPELIADFPALLNSPHIGQGGLFKNLRRLGHHNHRPDRITGELISILWGDIEEKVLTLDAITCAVQARQDSLVPHCQRLAQIVNHYALSDISHVEPQINPRRTVAEIMKLHAQADLR